MEGAQKPHVDVLDSIKFRCCTGELLGTEAGIFFFSPTSPNHLFRVRIKRTFDSCKMYVYSDTSVVVQLTHHKLLD